MMHSIGTLKSFGKRGDDCSVTVNRFTVEWCFVLSTKFTLNKLALSSVRRSVRTLYVTRRSMWCNLECRLGVKFCLVKKVLFVVVDAEFRICQAQKSYYARVSARLNV